MKDASVETLCSEPFLVLIRPAPKARGSIGPYDLRLVNPTASTLINVRTDTGGFFSDDELGVVDAEGKKREFGDVGPGGSLTIEQPDDDELYEFVIWWIVTYGDPIMNLHFSLCKNSDGVPVSPVPVVGSDGILIPRSR